MTQLDRRRRAPPAYRPRSRYRHAVLAFFAAAGILGFPVAAVAHDPGLSSLELRVGPSDIVADLSMAAADAAALVGSDADVARLGSFALQAIDLQIDGRRLEGLVDDIARQEGNAIRVRLRYVRTPDRDLRSARSSPAGLPEAIVSSCRSGKMTILSSRRECWTRTRMALAISVCRPPALIPHFSSSCWEYEHILGGYDHLLFLGALLLVARGVRDVVTTLTAFTVAHSLDIGVGRDRRRERASSHR